MSDGAEGQWYYARAGQQQGPISEAGLKQLLAAGQLSPSDVVWRQGMAQWSPAASVPGLVPAGIAAPQPPPYPPQGPYAPPPAAPLGYASYASPSAYGQAGGIGQDAGVRWLLPVGRSGWAIAAGYLGLLSFVIFPAPLALIFSIVAIIDIKKHPERHGMGRAIFGLVMGILGSIVLCFFLLGVLLAPRRY